MATIVPAILPYTKEDFEKTLALAARLPGVERVQFDVIDGSYTQPASWPYNNAAATDLLAEMTFPNTLPPSTFELDLMCRDPEPIAARWLALGAARIIFHYGALADAAAFLRDFRDRYADTSGARTDPALVSIGIALRPQDDAPLEELVPLVDFVQCMGIDEVGKQGEAFDVATVERVRDLRARYPELPLQVDGGVSAKHAASLAQAGASHLIVGSAIERAPDPVVAYTTLVQQASDPFERNAINKLA